MSDNPMHKPLPPSKKPIPVSSRLAQFLPFFKLPTPPQKPRPISTAPLPSHHPIQLKDPLPHLLVFTPFTITSKDLLVSSSINDGPVLRNQDITLTSPDDLLNIELHLSVATMLDAVNILSVSNVSPWAEAELGTKIRQQAKTGDISSLGWACGRYWDVASIRARCWRRCQEQYGHLLYKNGRAKKGADALMSNRESQLRQSTTGKANDLNSSGYSQTAESALPSLSISKSVISTQNLGRQSLFFFQTGVSLLVTWTIDFDWTGEAESHVSACAAFPKSWRNVDERASLDQVPALFSRLVRERGVYAAVRITLALLFPTES